MFKTLQDKHSEISYIIRRIKDVSFQIKKKT